MERDSNGRFVRGHKPYKAWLGKKRGKPSREWRDKISNSLVGKAKSDVHRRNISLSKRGEKNPSYIKGKTKDSHGYWMIRKPNHPNVHADGRYFEHRLVVESELGRHLKRSEHVHHIDFDIGNNDISNLFIVSASQHSKLHHSVGKLMKSLLEEDLIYFDKKNNEYKVKRRNRNNGAAPKSGI